MSACLVVQCASMTDETGKKSSKLTVPVLLAVVTLVFIALVGAWAGSSSSGSHVSEPPSRWLVNSGMKGAARGVASLMGARSVTGRRCCHAHPTQTDAAHDRGDRCALCAR